MHSGASVDFTSMPAIKDDIFIAYRGISVTEEIDYAAKLGHHEFPGNCAQ